MDNNPAHSKALPLASYTRFFWPLSLMGVAMLAGRLAQNFVLLGFDDGVEELAWYALAGAVFNPFRAGIGMMPQMVTVWGKTAATRHRCLLFITLVCGALTVPVLFLAWTPLGPKVVATLFALPVRATDTIVLYLRYMTPTICLMGWRQFIVGLLIRRDQTGRVTLLKCLDLLSVIAVLAVGIALRATPSSVVGLSALLPQGLGLAAAIVLVLKSKRVPDEAAAETPQLKTLFRYFWPLAGTTSMFTLSRPIIFRLVRALNPTDNPAGANTTMMIAALSLAFSVGMVFQITVNQVRHVIVRYGAEDPHGVRRFVQRLALAITAIMIATLASPLARLFLVYGQGAQGGTLHMSLHCLWVLVPVPVVIAWRNYYHGLALVHHRTTAMVIGGLARNGSILIAGFLLLLTHSLSHWTAASLLVLAFLAEALTVTLFTRNWRAALVV